MSLYEDFHAVKGDSSGRKLASDPGVSKCLLWNNARHAAEADPNGPLIGLAKMALAFWAETDALGEKTAASREERDAWAASFAAAYVVHQAIEKMAAEGELDESGASKLAALNAEAAFEDLLQLTKTAGGIGSLLGAAKNNPRVTGGVLGGVIGAGIGAWKDDDNRARGAAAGALPGAAIGALVGPDLLALLTPGKQPGKPKMPSYLKTEDAKGLPAKSMFHPADEMSRAANRVQKGTDQAVARGKERAALSNLPRPGEMAKAPGDALDALNSLREQMTHKQEEAAGAPSGMDRFRARQQKAKGLKKGAALDPTQVPGNEQQPPPQDPNAQAQAGGQPPPQDPNAQAQAGGQPPAQGDPSAQAGRQPPAQGGEGGEGLATDPGPGGHPPGTEQLGQSPEEAAMQQQQQQADQMAKELQQHHTTVDNLAFLADQVGLPSMSQEIQGTRDDLVNHFASGNTFLPHSLQKYFPRSEHAEQFIQKYKQRFAPLTSGGGKSGGGGGSKKAASELPFWLKALNVPFDLA